MFAFNNKGQSGFTLLELMLASLLSMILLGVLVQLYLTHLKLFNSIIMLTDKMHTVQVIFDTLSTEVKQAGYMGCAKLRRDFPIYGYHEYNMTPESKLIITQHALTVRHASYQHAELVYPTNHLSQLIINRATSFQDNDILMISDCQHAEIFQARHVSRDLEWQRITPTEPLRVQFESGAEISRFEINQYTFYNHALYLDNINHSKVKLASGILDINFDLDQITPNQWIFSTHMVMGDKTDYQDRYLNVALS